MKLNNATLHHYILQSIVDRGWAPTATELAAAFDVTPATMNRALHDLADYHGVVLHPGSAEVWVAHPFSLAPTGFIVAADGREWWGTCAWCSLGVAELVGGTATITTRLAHTGDPVTVRIESGVLQDTDYVIHFPIPMTRAWDNVIYTCSMMLLFRDGASVDAWCAAHNKPRGDVQPITRVWDFARDWYGRHLDEDWRKWTGEEAATLFANHGLVGPIWELPGSTERF